MATQREILRLCGENELGRIAWPLAAWEANAKAACASASAGGP